jgi:hypothetical protein
LLASPKCGLALYHNKLIREDGGKLTEVGDVPCKRWTVRRKKPSQAKVDIASAVKDTARHKNAIDRAVLRQRGRGQKPPARKTIFT